LAGGGWSTIFITAVLLACTIIGIPFAWAHVKVAGLAIAQLRRGGTSKKARASNCDRGCDADLETISVGQVLETRSIGY
jgi:uncharacterized membrane protein YccF (DUF307 family)